MSPWPKDTASKVQFVVPDEWTAAADKDNNEKRRQQQKLCRIDYDESRRLLRIVVAQKREEEGEEETTDIVLDCFDPDDMIGAKLEIVPKAEETNNDASAAEEGEAEQSEEKNESSSNGNNRADNEPQSDALRDNSGAAVLRIYSYPKVDGGSSRGRSFVDKWLFRTTSSSPPSSSSHTVPNPTYYVEKKDRQQKGTAATTTAADAANDGPPKRRRRRAACHRRLQLAPTEDLHDATKVVEALQRLACPSSKDAGAGRRRLLVLINPNAGPSKKYGEELYRSRVKPVLEDEAGIDCDVVVTRSAEHARERLQEKKRGSNNNGDNNDGGDDLSQYDGLIVLGGDGTLHHAVNAVLARGDGRELLSSRKLPVAIVGCGSANGFMASAARESDGERCGVLEACYLICKGNTVPVDLAKYQTSNNTYTGFLTFSWAMVADIDIESERLHYLGELRFDLWAVIRILFLRHYRARFSYLPAATAENGSSSTAAATSTVSALTDDLPPGSWKTIEDEFILFWASNVSHAATATLQSPLSRMDDGVFHIMMVRKGISRFKLAQMLLAVSNGTHLGLDGVETLACTAFRLEPQTSGSFNDVDGEVVEDGPIQAQVLPSQMRTFVTK